MLIDDTQITIDVVVGTCMRDPRGGYFAGGRGQEDGGWRKILGPPLQPAPKSPRRLPRSTISIISLDAPKISCPVPRLRPLSLHLWYDIRGGWAMELAHVIARHVARVYVESGYNKTRAARVLGVSVRALRYWMDDSEKVPGICRTSGNTRKFREYLRYYISKYGEPPVRSGAARGVVN